MFCQKCGEKAIEGALFCQKCGAKLVNDEFENKDAEKSSQKPAENVPISHKEPVKLPQSTQVPEAKKKKNGNTTALLIIVLVVLLLFFAVIFTSAMMDKPMQETAPETTTPINETEQLSETTASQTESKLDDTLEAQNPADVSDISETNITESISEPAEPAEENEDDMIREAYFQKVRELNYLNNDLTYSLIDLTADDVYELVAEMPGYYVSVYRYNDGLVIPIMNEWGSDQWGYGSGGNQGYEYLPGKNLIRNCSFDTGTGLYYTSYLCADSYFSLTNVYEDSLCSSLASEEYYLGDSIISKSDYDAYQVKGDYILIEGTMTSDEMLSELSNDCSLRNDPSGEIYVSGIPASSLIRVPMRSIISKLGTPLEYVEGSYCKYNGFEFTLSQTGIVSCVELVPHDCTYDGYSLDINRDALTALIGNATNEGWENEYCMYYADFTNDYSVNFDFVSPDMSPCGMRIWTMDY